MDLATDLVTKDDSEFGATIQTIKLAVHDASVHCEYIWLQPPVIEAYMWSLYAQGLTSNIGSGSKNADRHSK